MSRFRLANKLRQNEYWKPMLRCLDEAGVTRWELHDSKPHPVIVFTYAGREVRFTVPGTPRGGGKDSVLSRLRRTLRGMGAAT